MVAVITCLCLSCGEGLRLRPFPAFGLVDAEATNAQGHIEGAINHQLDILTNKYCQLILTAQLQKRNKQQVTHRDNGIDSSQSCRELTVHTLLSVIPGGAVDIVSLFGISRTPSRAPPFIS